MKLSVKFFNFYLFSTSIRVLNIKIRFNKDLGDVSLANREN